MADGLMELGLDIISVVDKLNTALEDGDIEEAKTQITKMKGRLEEMEKGIDDLPETGDVDED